MTAGFPPEAMAHENLTTPEGDAAIASEAELEKTMALVFHRIYTTKKAQDTLLQLEADFELNEGVQPGEIDANSCIFREGARAILARIAWYCDQAQQYLPSRDGEPVT